MAERRAFSVAVFCRHGGEILLVRHKRLDLWLPVGGEIEAGETPLEAARRELREETGLEADSWEPVGSMFALNGVCHAPEHVFLARGLRASDQPVQQAEEGITSVRRVPWPQVLRLVADGTITDGETVAALMYAAIALGRVA